MTAAKSLEAQATAAHGAATIVKERAEQLVSKGGRESVSKADAAARRLHDLAQRYVDRHPIARSGDDMTIEQALVEIGKTREGKRAMREVQTEGDRGEEAVRKAFDMDAPEPEPTPPTRGQTRLDSMAASVAKARGISKEQALVEVIKTADGRVAHADHQRELAARSA